MQTYRTRLNPIKAEVLKVTEDFGVFRAMTQFHCPSYDRFKIWLKETTGNENFGLHPKIDLADRRPLGDQLVEAILRKVSQMESQLREKDQRIHFLEWQLDQGKTRDLDQVMLVLENCKV